MKLIAVILLCLGLLCSTTLAVAEGPVPFNALMHAAGAPSVPPLDDAKDQSTAVSTYTAHTHMTTGGKIMTGVGIGIFAIGAVELIGTALFVHDDKGSWFQVSSSDQAKLYGVGGGLLAGGVTLVVLGSHRRSAK